MVTITRRWIVLSFLSSLKINWWLLWISICFINRSICTCITCLGILPWCPFIIPLIYYQDDWMHNNELRSVQRQLIWYSATELIPMKMLNIDHLLKLLLMYKCGHRTLLSKRQVWMSIFHIINFKKNHGHRGPGFF